MLRHAGDLFFPKGRENTKEGGAIISLIIGRMKIIRP
jgi:hypothetical protein